MSDLTMYIFTNPDEALNAKFQALLDAAIQSLESDETKAEPDAET